MMLVIEIYDEMIILNIKVSKCNKDKDKDNIMIITIKVIMLLIVVN